MQKSEPILQNEPIRILYPFHSPFTEKSRLQKQSAFFNDVCLRQMMLASPSDVRLANDAWLRHILWQTSHHLRPTGATSFWAKRKTSYRRRRYIIFARLHLNRFAKDIKVLNMQYWSFEYVLLSMMWDQKNKKIMSIDKCFCRRKEGRSPEWRLQKRRAV